jgi:glycosyltransferase involved in cell wall biosynthesis
MAQVLGIADRVVFPGFYSNMPQFMAALDLCVMPSTCDDVMPLVLMEAMAAGCSVIASDVGSVRELIQHEKTRILVPPADPAATADAMLRMIDDPDLSAAIASAGQIEVQRCFSIGRMVEEMDGPYREVLDRSTWVRYCS